MTMPRARKRASFTLPELLVVLAIFALLFVTILPWIARIRRVSSRITCVNKVKQIGLAFQIFGIDNEDKFPMKVSMTNGGSQEFVEDARQMWRHFAAMSNELSTPKVLICEEDRGGRKEATVFSADSNAAWRDPDGKVVKHVPFNQNANVSYFVGVDSEKKWTDSLLAGDRHLTVGKREIATALVLLTNQSLVAWSQRLHKGYGNVAFGDGRVEQLTSPRLREAVSTTGLATNRLALP